ncbi:MAG: CoA transferase [Candidatus Abyssobacteria bacterium SURF_17]|uniref:CoA transferase n=1 Tax=Candidatus Abyssobacteria bacterium SURF_17 TaxID=2093361 RepID=A0A419F9K8_9BACT|nr:MAG: CoA transferase [Candidatus Abyssubacteria bacterium SURF_17]
MQKMLEGVRILDLSRMLAGPYGSMLLGDLGAEIIKIEEPGEGDLTRTAHAQAALRGISAYFLSINRSKKSVTLNLKSEKGRAIFYEMVKKADVVYDNFRPAALEKLGCTYEVLSKHNPRIICCSVSAFGHDGPYRDLPAYDIILQAIGGTMGLTGPEIGEPVLMGVPMGDLAGGIFGALAISAALYQRERTGRGQKLDVSLLDSQISLLVYLGQTYIATGEIPLRRGAMHPLIAPFRSFKTKDGHIAVVAFQDKFFESFCKIIEREDLLSDERFDTMINRALNKAELYVILDEIFPKKTTAEWLEPLREAQIPSGPVNNIQDALNDPQVRHRNMVVEIDHPEIGKYEALGNPVKSSVMKDGEFLPPPTLGQHTEEVLTSLAGLSAEEIRSLRDEGVI